VPFFILYKDGHKNKNIPCIIIFIIAHAINPKKNDERLSSSSIKDTAIAPIEENGDTAVVNAPTVIAENRMPASIPPAATPGTSGKKVVFTTKPLTKKLMIPEKVAKRTGEKP
jgi:hypothetical protein